MIGFILGEKKGCDRIFADSGNSIPVTKIDVDECYLIGLEADENGALISIKLAFKSVRKIKKPMLGELKKVGINKPLRYFKTFRLKNFTEANKIKVIKEGEKKFLSFDDKKIAVGSKVSPLHFFKKGFYVDIAGISKGKGFQGTIKRHNFACGPRTHGQSDRRRAPGSLGQTTTPGRVYKGKRMAGRMGGNRVTVKGLEIIEVLDNEMVVKGLVPGSTGSLLEIKSSFKND